MKSAQFEPDPKSSDITGESTVSQTRDLAVHQEEFLSVLQEQQKIIEKMRMLTDCYTAKSIQMLTILRNKPTYLLGRLLRTTALLIKTKKLHAFYKLVKAGWMRLLGISPNGLLRALPPDILDAQLSLIGEYKKQITEALIKADGQQKLEHYLLHTLLNEINQMKNSGCHVICVMAPIFTSDSIRDGYFRRIKAIDDLMGSKALRIYICWLNSNSDFVDIQRHDEYHVRVAYDKKNPRHNQVVMQIAKAAGVAYHHSVSYLNEAVMRCDAVRKIVDLHGVVPEELTMYEYLQQAEEANELEALSVACCDTLVVVTLAMQRHIAQKYPQASPHFINLPILDREVINAHGEIQSPNYVWNKPVVVYAGGLQKWQMIPQMQQAIQKARDKGIYRIFTPDSEGFYRLWGRRKKPATLSVESRTPEELMTEYNKCHYGFLLREDITVNNVACPTKLVEYLAFGIVPILNTPHIGDFVTDGMQYISLDRFISQPLPTEEERLEMVRANNDVLDKIQKRYQQGKAELKSLFFERH